LLAYDYYFFWVADIVVDFAKGQAPGQGAWCVAKASSTEKELVGNIRFACKYVDCSIIANSKGKCFYPNTAWNHASVVMNLYYQKQARHFWNCNFNGSALITVIDPSYGKCKYSFTRN
ncbi:glucan endo-1,3-beta-glucosidase-like, partial [Impatiens glandulifera]|uniref:glucan endo-1,3-beta-glucosidase-like n=1 Tax=Impatiens glandulifera TaxID=253017 RepID=UPI001FB12A51